jgi:DtxR family Mn-dependent transcriptional regulator
MQLDGSQASIATGQIARAMSVTPGTVTTMMKTLAESGLVAYKPYSGVDLTPAGLHIAQRVLRRHRVVELFLVKVLGMDWSEVHRDAEVLEHAVSDQIIERMDEMLESPRFDPHGDPIPSVQGTMVQTKHPSLLTCPLNTPLLVARILDQNANFLRYLEEHHLTPGSQVEVRERRAEIDTVSLVTGDGGLLSFGFRVAEGVLVETPG